MRWLQKTIRNKTSFQGGAESLFNKLFCSIFPDTFSFLRIAFNGSGGEGEKSFVLMPFTSPTHPTLNSFIFKANRTVIIRNERKNRIKVNESNNRNPWIKCHKTNELLCPRLKLIFVLCFHFVSHSVWRWILMNDFESGFDYRDFLSSFEEWLIVIR